MKSVLAVLLIALAALGVFFLATQQNAVSVAPGNVEVYFSPKGGCEDAVVRQIGAAQKSVHVLAYSFTSPAIAEALLSAHHRGLDVLVVVDHQEARDAYSEARSLADQGLAVFTDAQHAIAHNKVMILDAATVITGSFNFTRSAEHANAENLLILHSPELAAKYEPNFQLHLAHSEKFSPQSEPAKPATDRRAPRRP